MIINTGSNKRDVLAYIANLRYVRSLLETSKNNLDACLIEPEVDKISMEGLKEVRQDVEKAIIAIVNELGRFPIMQHIERINNNDAGS